MTFIFNLLYLFMWGFLCVFLCTSVKLWGPVPLCRHTYALQSTHVEEVR